MLEHMCMCLYVSMLCVCVHMYIMCVSVCLRMCVSSYIYMCVCSPVYLCVHVCMHACTCLCVNLCMCICVHACVCACNEHMHVSLCISVNMKLLYYTILYAMLCYTYMLLMFNISSCSSLSRALSAFLM